MEPGLSNVSFWRLSKKDDGCAQSAPGSPDIFDGSRKAFKPGFVFHLKKVSVHYKNVHSHDCADQGRTDF